MQKCKGDLCIYQSVTSLNGSVDDLHLRVGKTNATHIRFEFCNLPKFFESFSARHRDITEVIAKKGNISELSADTFLCATKLKILDLSDNNFRSIYKHYFMGAVNLEELNLSNNKIEEIEAGTFDCLPKLKTLNLSFNRIRTLPSEIFSNNPQLSRVELNENAIKQLDSKIFFDNTQLIKINLAQNQLQELVLEFSNNNLATLDVSNNSLKKLDLWSQETIAGTKFYLFAQENMLDTLLIVDFNVVVINVSFNLLKSLNFLCSVEYKNLKWANVSKNQIKTVDAKALNILQQLNYIGLENNLLENFPVKDLRGLVNLKELDLQHNRIRRFFAEDVLKSFPKIKSIDLRGNPIRKQYRESIFSKLSKRIIVTMDDETNESGDSMDENDEYDAMSQRLREVDEFDGLSIISQSELSVDGELKVVDEVDDFTPSTASISESETIRSEASGSGVNVIVVCSNETGDEQVPKKPPRLFTHFSSPSNLYNLETEDVDHESQTNIGAAEVKSDSEVKEVQDVIEKKSPDEEENPTDTNLEQTEAAVKGEGEELLKDSEVSNNSKGDQADDALDWSKIFDKLCSIRLDQINFILLLVIVSAQIFRYFNE